MPPSERPDIPSSAPARRPTANGPIVVPPAGSLEDLRQAAQRHADRSSARPPAPGGGIALAVILAAVVGTALLFSGDFTYRGAALFRVAGEATEERLEVYRRTLIAHAMPAADGAAEGGRWHVQRLGDRDLQLSVVADSRERAAAVRDVANSFLALLEAETESARRTPGEAERLMADYADRLQQRYQKAQSDLESAIANLPASDPRESRGNLLDRWRSMRDTFATAREDLAAAKRQVDELQTSPPPTEGTVAEPEREAAFLADATLQQDLKELEVSLTELKLAALNAWQESARHLQEALKHSEEFNLDAFGKDTADEARLRAGRFAAELRRYHEDLAAFSTRWDAAFTSLQQEPVNPRSESILDLHQQARTLLGDFLFQASERLSSLRSHTQIMAEGLNLAARHHVLHSEVVRRFTTVQDAHHRFAFAAGMVEPGDNFRLDAALRSSRGLRRRAQEAIGEIDLRLAAEARERALADRLRRIDEAQARMRSTRDLADRTVEEIVALQEELNISTEMTESFLRSMVRKDAADNLAQLALQDFSSTEELVLALRAKRLAGIDAARVELVQVDTPGRPENLGAHVRTGLVGFGGTLLVLGLARWRSRR